MVKRYVSVGRDCDNQVCPYPQSLSNNAGDTTRSAEPDVLRAMVDAFSNQIDSSAVFEFIHGPL